MRIDEVVSLLDLAPTVADLAGLPAAPDFVGRSLLAAGSEVNPPMAVGELVAEGKALARYAREGRWKVVVEHDVAARLFDLERDPGETRDVATEHPEEAAYMATLATTRPELPAAASAAPDGGPSAEERQRRAATLRALGYAE